MRTDRYLAIVRIRLSLFVAGLLLCPACSSITAGTGQASSVPGSAASTSSAPPSESGRVQAALCQRLSGLFTSGKLPRAFRPSTTYVPTVLTHTGFGRSAAECEVNPRLAIYYLALIWNRTIGTTRISAFEQQLRQAGFRHTPGSNSGTFTAPRGIPAVVAGVRTDMQSVIIFRSARDGLTAVVWI